MGMNDSLLLITNKSEPTVCSGWVISCVTKAQGWGGTAFVLCDGSRICLFSRFLQPPFDKINPVRCTLSQLAGVFYFFHACMTQLVVVFSRHCFPAMV